MEDNTDAFARLQRLRVQGVLTDAEYEKQKAQLLGRVATAPLGWRERWRTGRETGRGVRRAMMPWTIGSMVVILLIGAYFFGKGSSLAETRGELGTSSTVNTREASPVESDSTDDSPWTFSTKTDPMTDATLSEASATFEGNQFNIEVVVRCSSTGDMSYTATSFDKENKSAEMRSEILDNLDTTIPFQARPDNQKAVSLNTNNPKFNNQAVLNYDASDAVGTVPNMAAASKVVFRFSMLTGDETIELPQTGQDFRALVSPCTEKLNARRRQFLSDMASEERRYRERQIPSGPPLKVQRQNPSGPVNAM